MPRFPALCLAFLLLVAGCTSPVNQLSGTPEPKSLPERPQTITNETARSYATGAEAVHRYNSVLERHPTDTSLNCEGTVLGTFSGARVVHVTCTGGIEFADGTHADVLAKALYWVERDDVRRVPESNGTTAREFQEFTGSQTAGFVAYNLGDKRQQLNATLQRAGGDEVRRQYRLNATSALIQNRVPFDDRNTTYGFVAETRGDGMSFTWRPATTDGERGHLLIVYVTPRGNVAYGRLPTLAERNAGA
jgi:hypothetical protein